MLAFPFLVLDIVLMGRAPYLGIFSSPITRDESLKGAYGVEVRIINLDGLGVKVRLPIFDKKVDISDK
ncbi:MAG: hypothetical protein J7M13_04480 [Synergistetes bacterium]|nr:hypothetical protein [Synergistota bacterium]